MFQPQAQGKRGRAAAAAKPAFSVADLVKQPPRVYFASRTHSQLAQVGAGCRWVCARVYVVGLGGCCVAVGAEECMEKGTCK
jgi:hypothetical protein